MKKLDIMHRTLKVVDAAETAPRKPEDWVEFIHEGAEDIAKLTAIARAQQFEFDPAIAALERLAALADWNHHFVVADTQPNEDGSPRFRWQDSPYRKFESFADFYSRELEPVWGKWEELRAHYRSVRDDPAAKRAAEDGINRAAKAAAVAASQPAAGKVGDNQPLAVDNSRNIHGRPTGTSSARRVAVLRKTHPAIAERLAAGEFKSVAAAVRVANGQPADLPPLTPLEKFWRSFLTLSPEDRDEFDRRRKDIA